jgi:hypothetical protein
VAGVDVILLLRRRECTDPEGALTGCRVGPSPRPSTIAAQSGHSPRGGDGAGTAPFRHSAPVDPLVGGVQAPCPLALVVDGETIGAINLYRRRPVEFTRPQIESAWAFARQAMTAMTIVRRHADHIAIEGQLRAALDSRSVIDQALESSWRNGTVTPPRPSRSSARLPSR